MAGWGGQRPGPYGAQIQILNKLARFVRIWGSKNKIFLPHKPELLKLYAVIDHEITTRRAVAELL